MRQFSVLSSLGFPQKWVITSVAIILALLFGVALYTKQNNHYRTLSEEERFEICLGAILTQNTAWKNVEKSLVALQKHDLLDPQKLERMDMQKLALLIRSSGYHNQKAKKIRAFLDFLKQII